MKAVEELIAGMAAGTCRSEGCREDQACPPGHCPQGDSGVTSPKVFEKVLVLGARRPEFVAPLIRHAQAEV